MRDWFSSEVIPQVRQISLEIAAQLGREAGPPDEEAQQDHREMSARMEEIGIKTFRPAELVSSASPDVLARLDAIILEAGLLKQEIQKIR